MAAVALRMPSHYVPVEAEEMEYVERGATLENVVVWLGEAILGDLAVRLTYKFGSAIIKTLFVKTGAWAAIQSVGVVAFVSRVVAIVALAGIVAGFGYLIYNDAKILLES